MTDRTIPRFQEPDLDPEWGADEPDDEKSRDFFDFSDEQGDDEPYSTLPAETFAKLMIPDDGRLHHGFDGDGESLPEWLQSDEPTGDTLTIKRPGYEPVRVSFPQRSTYGYKLSKQSRGMIIQRKSRERGVNRMKDFVRDGIAWWIFDREQMWADLAADSFESWLADPENKIGHGTTYGTDAVQSVDLFHKFFAIKASLMFGVGWGKFQVINPEVEKLRREVVELREMAAQMRVVLQTTKDNAGDDPDLAAQQQINSMQHRYDALERSADEMYRAHRERAKSWLIDAQNLSVRDLKDQIAAEPGNGGWITYFSSPMDIGTLKTKTATELLEMFGLVKLPDDYSVVIDIKGKDFEGLF